MDEPRFFEEGRTPGGRYQFETPIMPAMPTSYENTKAMLPAIRWCRDQFGEHNGRWAYGIGRIFITDATDATAFKLRWVGGSNG